MKYYVEINGKSSLNIQGLAIQSLPAISKPLMRSKRTEIDGRDGDIITKLGYSAYDKTLKIGLWGNYDINQVIAFFNQEGVITFSNEPDIYYNFTILNREDYINQLEAFREASITIHCQPYKYELNEQPVELENEYVEETGTSLTFENSIVADMDISLKGNTLQNGTPTPSSPIPINNVSGDNQIKVENSTNVFSMIDYATNNSAYYSYSRDNGLIMLKTDDRAFGSINLKINVEGNKTYYLKTTSNLLFAIAEYNSSDIWIKNDNLTSETRTFTTNANCSYIKFKCSSSGLTYPYTIGNIYISQNENYEVSTYNIDLPVENLFDKDNPSLLNGYVNYLTGVFTAPTTNNQKCFYVKVKPNTKYIWYDYTTSTTLGYGLFTNIPSANSNSNNYGQISATKTITTGANDNYLVMFYSSTNTSVDLTQFKVGNGTEITTYSIELNKIGTYQDYFYKEDDKWYLHKEIGKITLSNCNWTQETTASSRRYGTEDIKNIVKKPPTNGTTMDLLSNIYIKNNASWSWNATSGKGIAIQTNGAIIVYDDSYTASTDLSNFTTMLSNTNAILEYPLATPTNTEITYTPLIEQLESIKNAMSKEGTTNVNQVNNDAPFIITASVLCGDNSVVVNNKGNIYSKPIMTIYGSGNIGVYLSDSQIFSINLGDEEYITLDTANMEAYKVGVLKNRLVSGDYNSFKLETGNNTISFTGNVKKVEIQNYSRWI